MKVRGEELLRRLDAAPRHLLERCGALAEARSAAAYLVGGCVRDLILERPPVDLDVVVAGDGLAVAQDLARACKGHLIRYHAFQTARVDAPDGTRLDVATARREVYPRPGQLPQVEVGSLEEDLYRRDFTLNALAVCLNPDRWGDLVDRFGGVEDLQAGVIRVMHSRSFNDDPTRILRALRFAQRFGYRIEERTEAWLQEAVEARTRETVSGDRVRRELAYLLHEDPVDGPLMLEERGILGSIDPSLRAKRRVVEALREAREWYAGVLRDRLEEEPKDPWARALAKLPPLPSRRRGPGAELPRPGPDDPAWALVLAACGLHLKAQERWRLARRLRLSRRERLSLIETGAPWQRAGDRWRELAAGGSPAASEVHRLLRHLTTPALLVALTQCLATDDEGLAGAIRRYLRELQWVELEVTGEDLLELGVAQGPELGELLGRLLAARLDGAVSGREEELGLVRRWVQERR